MTVRHRSGFTLIELMVTISILAIVLAIAAPSFVEFQRNSQLRAAVNTFVAGLNAARTEAMKRNVAAMVVPIDGAWKNGFSAFADIDLDGVLDETKDKLIMRQAQSATYLDITGNGTAAASSPYFRFDGSGFGRTMDNSSVTNLTLTFARNDGDAANSPSQIRRLIVNVAGRIRVCTPTSATDSNCRATGE